MGSKQEAPAAPDYVRLAQQTQQSNQQAAQQATAANRINQNTPYGSITYSNNPQLNVDAWNRDMAQYGAEYDNWLAHGQPQGLEPTRPNQSNYMTDQWTSNIQLTPDQQKLVDQGEWIGTQLNEATPNLINRIAQNAQQGVTADDLPGLIYGIGDGSTGDTWSKYSDLMMSRLNPDLDKQQAALDTKLANMGLTAGSEGWNTQQQQFGQQRNDANVQAQLAGANLALQGAQLNNATRQQQVTERNLLQQIPLQQLASLRQIATQGQVNPTFYTPGQQGQTAGADFNSAGQNGYNSALNAVNANNAQVAGNTQAGVGLAGTAIMAAAMY